MSRSEARDNVLIVLIFLVALIGIVALVNGRPEAMGYAIIFEWLLALMMRIGCLNDELNELKEATVPEIYRTNVNLRILERKVDSLVRALTQDGKSS